MLRDSPGNAVKIVISDPKAWLKLEDLLSKWLPHMAFPRHIDLSIGLLHDMAAGFLQCGWFRSTMKKT